MWCSRISLQALIHLWPHFTRKKRTRIERNKQYISETYKINLNIHFRRPGLVVAHPRRTEPQWPPSWEAHRRSSPVPSPSRTSPARRPRARQAPRTSRRPASSRNHRHSSSPCKRRWRRRRGRSARAARTPRTGWPRR